MQKPCLTVLLIYLLVLEILKGSHLFYALEKSSYDMIHTFLFIYIAIAPNPSTTEHVTMMLIYC